MQFGKLVTIDGELFVESSLDCHIDSPLKKVLRGYESFSGDYYFVTELPDEYGESFGFMQNMYGWEWGRIYENQLRVTLSVWRIKDSDLPIAGKRGDYY